MRSAWPVRFKITPGRWGDRPRAQGLVAGIRGVGHVIADAAYDADRLRRLVADHLGAKPQIKQSSSCAQRQPPDRALRKERYLVEGFFNGLKRLRRTALRCEKTVGSQAFVAPARAMARHGLARLTKTPPRGSAALRCHVKIS